MRDDDELEIRVVLALIDDTDKVLSALTYYTDFVRVLTLRDWLPKRQCFPCPGRSWVRPGQGYRSFDQRNQREQDE